MRAWKVVGKYPFYSNGEITHTEIAIASTTGSYATYTEKVVGNHMDKPESELVELAREAHFKSEYADRAMAESVQKIDELEVAVKKLDEIDWDANVTTDQLDKYLTQVKEELSLEDESIRQEIVKVLSRLTALEQGSDNPTDNTDTETE
ncbi:hypothetical protein NOL38_08900 [Streptococcus suis]|uniref:hypothetical protein n=1 Tax=Streptococcus suis TaxID=1307 RepID=UPI002412CCF4|nr:hypothetical protein [Streptococcus suis]MDG4506367.1 hypothetical protein [Streptococcus suis]